MGTTADKLNKLLETKAAIKQAIIDKGVDISDEDTFASYPEKISSIQSGGGEGSSDKWFDIFTNNGTRGAYLFNECGRLTELDLSNLDTSEITNMTYMFYGCYSLTELDLSSFKTGRVTNFSYMFSGCSALKYLIINDFDTSRATTMAYMFSRCSSLVSMNLNHFNVNKASNINGLCYNCTSLTLLDCSTWDISHITAVYNLNTAFDGCPKLVDFYPPQNINASMSVTYSNALSHDSLLRIINNLMETTSTKTLTLGTTNLAKISDEEKAIATNKGWTLA